MTKDTQELKVLIEKLRNELRYLEKARKAMLLREFLFFGVPILIVTLGIILIHKYLL